MSVEPGRVRVSVVMPCFNAASHLSRSIGSLQQQRRTDWELVAVDDGSRDDTWTVLQEQAQADPRIKPVRQANAGAAAARNAGLRLAQGEFTAFLDSDDTWDPDFLSEMVGALQGAPDAGIAYCGWQNIGLGSNGDKPYVPPDYERPDKLETLLRACPWPIHGALVRSQLIYDAGGFDESMSSCMDYDLWLRLGIPHRLVLVPRVLAFYHHNTSVQITSNKARIALNHLRAQQKYLACHPEVAVRLGRRRIRQLTLGEALHRGYVAYWRRDLPAARTIFRTVMEGGYGGVKDWLYMLPSWLPESWHRALLRRRDAAPSAESS